MSSPELSGATSLTLLLFYSSAADAETLHCEIDFGPIVEPLEAPHVELHDGPAGDSAYLPSHGQLLFGEEAVYLHHLPFLIDDPDRHPHNFQAMIRVSFVDDADKDAYLERRKQFPDALFTALPRPFNQDRLAAIFNEQETAQRLGRVELYDQHFENIPPPEPFQTAELIVEEEVQFRKLLPRGATAETLSYLIIEGEQ